MNYSACAPEHYAGHVVGVCVDGCVVLLASAPPDAIAWLGLHEMPAGAELVEHDGAVVGCRVTGGAVALRCDAPAAALLALGLPDEAIRPPVASPAVITPRDPDEVPPR